MTAVPAIYSSQWFVNNGDVRIAVFEQGNPDGPTVVMVHGWPDSHVLWDHVVPLLADRFRVITYDNRGVGASSAPRDYKAYTTACIGDDLGAVIDAVSPDRPVHVLAHDWGSISTWEYLKRPGAGKRIASFTSVSGPSQDHVVAFLLDRLKRPYRLTALLAALNQWLRLSYMIGLSVPVLAPALVRVLFTPRRMRKVMSTLGKLSPESIRHSEAVGRDAANTVKIYRANYFRGFAELRRDFYVDVPVQLIGNTHDAFLRPDTLEAEVAWTPRLWRRDIKAGHWSPFSHPRVLATAVSEFADAIDGGPPSRAMLRAQVNRRRGSFGDMLVSVTGAGSGIGRATAFEFARQGAEVVVSDVDEDSVRETAKDIAAAGGVAHAYTLDVSDPAAVEAFAEEVCTAHGVPDIIVNNAGVGQAGSFIGTSAEEFNRVMDINFGGVVAGCRAFGRRMVERGTGGHIVNVASAAAFSPLQSLNAYCTSKAAVFMFSDCLRAELDADGIGVTTICPGPVATNIVRSARFAGPAGEAEQLEDRRGQWEKLFVMRRFTPEKAAKAIVSAVQKNKPIRPITTEGYLLYGTSKVAPQALRNAARLKAV